MSNATTERRSGAEEEPHPDDEQVLPLLAERVSVSRRRVETGSLRAAVTTQTHEQIIEEDLVHERVEVERIAVNRVVETVPPIREEGNTTIIPVVEEVLVIERRLVLKEEVHVRRVTVRESHVEAVVTRSQDVAVTRIDLRAGVPTKQSVTTTPTHTRTQKRIKMMPEETIVAVFDTAEQADAAVRDLMAENIPEQAITRHDRTASGMTTARETDEVERPREEGFWSRLFGGDRDYDHQVYDRSVESGSTVISVRVADEHVTRVAEVLDRHHPVDIDERASGYGLTDGSLATPLGAAAAAPPPGYAETPYAAPVARTAEIDDRDDRLARDPAYRATGSDLTDTGTVASGATPGTDYDSAALRTPATRDGLEETETLRLAEERLTVGKRLINRGGTRVRRYVVETPVEEQVNLHDERVTLDRRPVTDGQPISDADFSERTIEMTETTEEAVVSKEAFVTEEIRLRREAVDRVETVRDTVRRDEVEVERIPDETVTTTPRR